MGRLTPIVVPMRTNGSASGCSATVDSTTVVGTWIRTCCSSLDRETKFFPRTEKATIPKWVPSSTSGRASAPFRTRATCTMSRRLSARTDPHLWAAVGPSLRVGFCRTPGPS